MFATEGGGGFGKWTGFVTGEKRGRRCGFLQGSSGSSSFSPPGSEWRFSLVLDYRRGRGPPRIPGIKWEPFAFVHVVFLSSLLVGCE